MKQKDIALIAVIAVISAVISIFVSKAIFPTSQSSLQQVPVVQSIPSSITNPDTHYFNSNSYDPTQFINIGPNDNTDPFPAVQPSQ
jgi:capsular polysaccharide biosynthesis protein